MLIKRLFFTIWLLITTAVTQAATFYVSSSTGSDANDGLSLDTAWQSIEKVNSIKFEDGSTVLFKRGDVFRGSISLLRFPNGATLSAYGEGENPVISGSVLITNWQPSSLGNGIFEADTSALSLYEDDIQHLFVNGELMTIARYPNVDAPNEKNWLETGEESLNSGKNTFIDPSLVEYGKPNDYWKGALLRIRNYSWTYTVREISGYNATTGKISYKSDKSTSQLPGWGYFIDNKLEELDYPGEWYYDASQKKIYLMPRHNLDPNSALIEGMTYNIGIGTGYEKENLTIEHLTLRHFSEQAIKLIGVRGITIQNCSFEHNQIGLTTWNGTNVHVTNNIFDKQLEGSIGLNAASDFDVQDSIVENNIITNTAMYPLYGSRYAGLYQGQGIKAFGSRYTIRRNYIENTGYGGIYLKDGGHHVVENNVIRNTLLLLNDGGAIAIGSDNNIVRGNFLIDTWGNIDESNGWGGESGMHHSAYGMGIGVDASKLQNNIIEGNVVANNRDMGIWISDFKNTIVSNNIIYNNDPLVNMSDKGFSANNTIESNIFYSLDSQQAGLSLTTTKEQGLSNNNFFCNPYNTLMGVRDKKYYDLEHWQDQFKNLDQNSRTCNFSAKEYVTEEAGDNLITNSTFDNDIKDWKGGITHDPNKVEMDGGSLKFEGSSSITYASYSSFVLQTDQYYRLRFSVIGEGFGSLRANISNENREEVLERRFYPYSSVERRDYEIVFKPQTASLEAKLFFSNKDQGDNTYWLDNVNLYPVNAQMVAKTEQSKLVMNPTNETQTIELPAGVEFFNLEGQTVSDQVTLEPYSAIILVRSDEDIPPSSPYLNLMQNGRRVTASWAPVVGATGYRLYYAEYPNAPEIFNIDMGTERQLSVDLPQGAAFYVAVAAYNTFGESGYSNIRYFIVKQ